MKKFMKVCGIIAGIMLLLGVIMVSVGGCGGGLSKVRDMAQNGELSINTGDLHFGWDSDWDTYDVGTEDIFDEAYEIIRDASSYEKSFTADEIASLEIEAGGCKLELLPSDDGEYHIVANHVSALQTYVEEGTLHVKGVKTGTWTGFQIDSVMYITVKVPREETLLEADLSLGAGEFTIRELNAAELEMELGAGQVTVDTIKADTLECKAGAGQITMDNVEISGNAHLMVGAGELVISGNLGGNVTAECGMGNLKITVSGSEEKDHNYDLECAAGQISVGDQGITGGLVSEQYIDNGAATEYKLSCALGNMSVSFK